MFLFIERQVEVITKRERREDKMKMNKYLSIYISTSIFTFISSIYLSTHMNSHISMCMGLS